MRHGLIIDRTRSKSWREAPGQQILQDRDWRLTILTDRPGPWCQTPGADVTVVVVPDLTDESLQQTVAAIHRDQPLAALSTASELFLDPVATLREALGIPGASVTYTTALRDKWMMKEIAGRWGLAHAAGVLGSDLSAACVLLERNGRCIVKPRRLSGTRGVLVIDDRSELLAWANSCEDPSSYLIEEFIAGPMLHADGLVIGGRLVAWQLSQYERSTHLAGGRTPLSSFTVDDPLWLARAEEFLNRVVGAWSLRDEVFHCEMFATDQGFVFCEIGGRPGGAGVTTVFEATRGVNLRYAKTLLDFCEDVPMGAVLPAHSAGGWSVFYAEGGRFLGIDDAGLNLHHTCEIKPRPGDLVSGRTFSGVGVVTYTFTGDDTASVREAIARYERGVRVLEEPADRVGRG